MIRILICPCGGIQTSACRRTLALSVHAHTFFRMKERTNKSWKMMFDYHMGFVVAVCFLKLLIMDVESAPEHSTPRTPTL